MSKVGDFELLSEESSLLVFLNDWEKVALVHSDAYDATGANVSLSNQLRKLMVGEIDLTRPLFVVVPNQKAVAENRKIPEEVMLEMLEAAKELGFKRVRFFSFQHNQCFEWYARGLPSAQEVAKIRAESLGMMRLVLELK